MDLTLLIFLSVYVAMGFGKLPGFKIDRTGSALVGALAMLSIGSISSQAAWNAIDYKTIGLLFGLMIVSGAFAVSGFYGWAAHKVATLNVNPAKLLAVFIMVSGILSSILTNDVVVVAMTPLLVSITLVRGLNPIPFLLGFCFAANAGSVGTLIGSPQNMIAAQALDVSFVELLKVAGLPAIISLFIVWGVICFLFRGKWETKQSASHAHAPMSLPQLNLIETLKASVVTVALVVLFIIDIWPQELVALAAAGILLINRKIASNDVLKEVDGNLILLIMGLFIVNAAMAATGLPQTLLADLKHLGMDLNDPLSLYATGAALSNIVGNNPTVMLLVPYLDAGADANALCAALALGTGFSSNMVIFGSLAGIVVVEQAKSCGVEISFMDFAKAGFPVSVICLVLAGLWIYLL
ncbi:MAG: SLC13 family permease [Advenella sp.]|uniref:SLC13 family permease n=1 Tax=unclassified Advenella TaxID=2685285 RepID=UPI00145F63F2|nr:MULTISPECIES: SLC13 family permease [unclassified Advenella]MDD3756645.1 SLC13 family permease [Advenella sp.]